MKFDLKDRQGIVRFYNTFKFRGHICITFELLSKNLNELLINNYKNGMDEGLIRRIA